MNKNNSAYRQLNNPVSPANVATMTMEMAVAIMDLLASHIGYHEWLKAKQHSGGQAGRYSDIIEIAQWAVQAELAYESQEYLYEISEHLADLYWHDQNLTQSQVTDMVNLVYLKLDNLFSS